MTLQNVAEHLYFIKLHYLIQINVKNQHKIQILINI